MTAEASEAQQATTQRQPWDRQPGEPARAFAFFGHYRGYGLGRSYPKAVRAYLGKRPARTRQQEFFQNGHPNPDRYVRNMAVHWQKKYGAPWRWVERAAAWDERQAELSQQEQNRLSAEAAIQLGEELVAWKDRQLKVAMSMQDGGGQIIARLLELTAEGNISDLALEDVREVVVDGDDRTETLTKGIGTWLPLAIKAVAEGRRLEALSRGESTERIALQLAPADILAIADAIKRDVPEDQQESVGEEVAAILRGERGNGDA